jgi:quercetin dioxygenase-like cupin family protein
MDRRQDKMILVELRTAGVGTTCTGRFERQFRQKPLTAGMEGFMTKTSRKFVHHYAGVAIVVGLLSSLGTWMATRFVTTSSAQPAPGAAKPLLIQPLADLPGREVRITVLDRAPGSSSPPHRHPGHHTFGYVVEGTYEFAIDGQPSRILNAGETFYEPPTAVHSVSRNPSTDKSTKIIVFMVADQKNPSTVADAP